MPKGSNHIELDLKSRYKHKEHYLAVAIPVGQENNRVFNVYYQTLFPTNCNSIHVLYVHGLNSYGGRLATFVEEKFLKHGITVSLMDLPGFGRSSGLHGLIHDFEDLVISVQRVVLHIRETQQIAMGKDRSSSSSSSSSYKQHLIGYGTSMGAHTLIRYHVKFTESALDGYILSSPLIRQTARKIPPALVVWILRRISYLIPWIPFLPRKPIVFPKDPEMEIMYRSDPFIYNGGMRLGTVFAILDGLSSFPSILKSFNGSPVLVLMGEKDSTVCVDAVKQFHKDNIGSKQKDFILYDDVDHDLMFERTINHTYFKDILTWIKDRFY